MTSRNCTIHRYHREGDFRQCDVATYNGITLARVPGPHDCGIARIPRHEAEQSRTVRCMLTSISTRVGTDADNLISDLDIWFDKKERRNYIYSTGRIGTQIFGGQRYVSKLHTKNLED